MGRKCTKKIKNKSYKAQGEKNAPLMKLSGVR
jgi:hypothetical protein